jgi:hypothetical protein
VSAAVSTQGMAQWLPRLNLSKWRGMDTGAPVRSASWRRLRSTQASSGSCFSEPHTIQRHHAVAVLWSVFAITDIFATDVTNQGLRASPIQRRRRRRGLGLIDMVSRAVKPIGVGDVGRMLGAAGGVGGAATGASGRFCCRSRRRELCGWAGNAIASPSLPLAPVGAAAVTL